MGKLALMADAALMARHLRVARTRNVEVTERIDHVDQILATWGNAFGTHSTDDEQQNARRARLRALEIQRREE